MTCSLEERERKKEGDAGPLTSLISLTNDQRPRLRDGVAWHCWHSGDSSSARSFDSPAFSGRPFDSFARAHVSPEKTATLHLRLPVGVILPPPPVTVPHLRRVSAFSSDQWSNRQRKTRYVRPSSRAQAVPPWVRPLNSMTGARGLRLPSCFMTAVTFGMLVADCSFRLQLLREPFHRDTR